MAAKQIPVETESQAIPLSFLGFEEPEIFFEVGVTFVNYAAGLMLLFSCFIAVINTIIFVANELVGTKFSGIFDFSKCEGPIQISSIRFSLCTMILVALNFLVASDVIDTLVKPASVCQMEDLYKLAMIAGVRTLLAYFLGKEVEEIEHSLKQHDIAKVKTH